MNANNRIGVNDNALAHNKESTSARYLQWFTSFIPLPASQQPQSQIDRFAGLTQISDDPIRYRVDLQLGEPILAAVISAKEQQLKNGLQLFDTSQHDNATVQPSRPSHHPFHARFWEAESTEQTPQQITHKINALMNAAEALFLPTSNDSTSNATDNSKSNSKTNPTDNPKSNINHAAALQKLKTYHTYLLSHKENAQALYPLLVESGAYFSQLEKLLKPTNDDHNPHARQIATEALEIFPPTQEYLHCIDGTRTRLMDGLQYIHNALGDNAENSSDLNQLTQHRFQTAFDQYVEHALHDHKLADLNPIGYHIHLPLLIASVLGIDEETIKQRDRYYFSPMPYIPSKTIFSIMMGLKPAVAKQLQGSEEALQASADQLFTQLTTSSFSVEAVDLLKTHPLIQCIQTLDPEFTLLSAQHIIMNEHDEPVEWNIQGVKQRIESVIHRHLYALNRPENQTHHSQPLDDHASAYSLSHLRQLMGFFTLSDSPLQTFTTSTTETTERTHRAEKKEHPYDAAYNALFEEQGINCCAKSLANAFHEGELIEALNTLHHPITALYSLTERFKTPSHTTALLICNKIGCLKGLDREHATEAGIDYLSQLHKQLSLKADTLKEGHTTEGLASGLLSSLDQGVMITDLANKLGKAVHILQRTLAGKEGTINFSIYTVCLEDESPLVIFMRGPQHRSTNAASAAYVEMLYGMAPLSEWQRIFGTYSMMRVWHNACHQMGLQDREVAERFVHHPQADEITQFLQPVLGFTLHGLTKWLLISSAKANHPTLTKTLLNMKLSHQQIWHLDDHRNNICHYAAQHNRGDLIECLQHHYPYSIEPLVQTNRAGYTPAKIALQSGHFTFLKHLYAAGLTHQMLDPIDHPTDKPLGYQAAEQGNIEFIQLLGELEFTEADLLRPDANGDRAHLIAARNGDITTLHALRQAGVSVEGLALADAFDHHIIFSALKGPIDTVPNVLDALNHLGIDPALFLTPNKMKLTPLQHFLQRYLIRPERTASRSAPILEEHHLLNILKAMLKGSQANINQLLSENRHPISVMHYCMRQGYWETIHWSVSQGLSTEALTQFNPTGLTPIHAALIGGHIDVFCHLVKLGVPPEALNPARPQQKTLAHLAAGQGQIAVIQAMIDAGVPRSSFTEYQGKEDSFNVANMALHKGHIEIVKLLAGIGVKPNPRGVGIFMSRL